jgi:hypothetical protein
MSQNYEWINTRIIPKYEWYIIKLRQKQAFEFGCADGASQGTRRGSHVYEINTWMWNFGRPQPRMPRQKGYAESPSPTRRAKHDQARQAQKRAAEEEEYR